MIVRAWKDQKFRFEMNVYNHLDLNKQRDLLRPIKVGSAKNFYGSFFAQGVIEFDAELPMSGFVAGQNMPLKVNVRNKSDVDVNEISIKLKQIITLHSFLPTVKTRSADRDLYVGGLDGVARDTNKSFELNVAAPVVPPTSRNLCKFIQFYYTLVIKPKFTMFSDESVSVFITIGTIPPTNTVRPVSDLSILALPNFDRRTSLPSYYDVLRENSNLESNGK